MKKKPIRDKKIQKRKSSNRGHWISEVEFSQLHSNLREAQETLEAIRGGEVDAVVVNGPNGNQIYSLTGADQPYRVYVERMQEGAATISGDGLILYANQRFADMVNQPLEKIISAEASTYLDAAAWKKIRSVFKNQNEVVKCETLLLPREKTYLPVNLTASHLPLPGQNVLCLVVTDLSAQKQNEELRLAKEVAEKANHAKDNFLAALSHELRTPLSPALLIASESANDRSLPEEMRLNFEFIRKNIELEARLIDDLLDLTRVTAGKMVLNRVVVDVHAILNDALEAIKPDCHKKNIRINLELNATPSLMKGDAVRLQQVFWNILKNAVKFTPLEGKITMATKTDNKEHIIVKIADTGIGMSPDELGRAFKAFVQGDHATNGHSHRFGGLGLGLAITKNLVELHSGNITAHSDGKGHGCTFTIKLPLAKETMSPASV